jgi:DNA-binding transcriptional ArsR family regulator
MSSSAEPEASGGASLKLHGALLPLREPKMRVELDKKTLFALASDTRVEILRAMVPMRRTVTQLSEALDIDKAAIHRHLKKMEEGGLVRRYEDHGFVYYGLTWKARDLMSPGENTRIVILFSASWMLSIAVVFLIALALMGGSVSNNMIPKGPSSYGNATPAQGSEQFFNLGPTSPLWFIGAFIVAVVAFILARQAYIRVRKPRQKRSSNETVPGQD